MRKEKKPSAYSQKRENSNVVNFVVAKSARSYRIEYSNIEHPPTLTLIAPLPDAAGGEKAIDISFLLNLNNLWRPFAEGLSDYLRASKSPFITVEGKCRDLRSGFCAYLTETAPNTALEDISTEMVETYITWLRRSENGVEKYKKSTKQKLWIAFTVVIGQLRIITNWNKHLSPDLRIRENIWKDDPDDRDQVEIIPQHTYRDIYIACKKEIIAIMAKVRHHRSLMLENIADPIALQGDINPTDPSYLPVRTSSNSRRQNPYKNLGLCLASLRHRVPGVILSVTELRNMQDRMLLNVVENKKPFGGIPELHFCFYPYIRDLVPFILMFDIHFDYNPETLLRSKLGDFVIRRNEVGSLELIASPENISRLGGRVSDEERSKPRDEWEIIASPRKGRSNNAKQIQIRPATDDPDNPASILTFLKEWMSFIRSIAPPGLRDLTFLYVTEQGNRTIRSLVGGPTAGRNSSWRNALTRFYKDNQLPHIAFNRFRITGLDITDAVFGGDIRAKQAAANHRSEETTYRLYSTNAQRQRGDQMLGEILQLKKRWRESAGKIDPRNKPNNSDLGAATPGWTCLDPYTGPYTPGKFCSSYGFCPVCPHGSIANDDPYACAQAWNLLKALDDAACEMAPTAWLERWSPVKKKLLRVWLPAFPESIQLQAKSLRLIKLPPLE